MTNGRDHEFLYVSGNISAPVMLHAVVKIVMCYITQQCLEQF